MRNHHHLKHLQEQKCKTRRQLTRLDDQYHHLLSTIELNLQGIGKHDRIKVQAWLKKLEMKVQNVVWKNNRNFYLKVLSEMTINKTIQQPFNKSPPECPLPRLTPYDVPYPLRSKFLNESEKKEVTANNGNNSKQHNSSAENQHSFVSTRKVSFNEFNKENISTENRLTNRVGSKSKSLKKMVESRTERSGRRDGNTDRSGRGLAERWDRQSFNATNRRITFNEGIVELRSKNSSNSDISQDPSTPNLPSSSLNSTLHSLHHPCDLLQAKTFNLLKRTFKFLMRNYDILQQQPEYTTIISDVIRLGDEKGVDLRNLNVEMSPSPSKIVFKKYSERIKENFNKSGEESKEFMHYLAVLRNR